MKKNNIRSFRQCDRVAEILELCDGDSLNAKFENLVLTCYDRLPDLQEEIKRHEKLLHEYELRCVRAYERYQHFQGVVNQMLEIQKKCDEVIESFESGSPPHWGFKR